MNPFEKQTEKKGETNREKKAKQMAKTIPL